MLGPASGSSEHRELEFIATMDIGLLVPPSGCPAAQPSSTLSSETGQCQQPTQSGTFSSFLEDAVKNTLDEKPSPLPNAGDPTDAALSTTMGNPATGATLIGIAVASLFQVGNLPEAVSPVTDNAGSLQNSTSSNLQNVESILLLQQRVAVIVPQDGVPLGDTSATAQKSIEDGPQGSESIPLLPQGATVIVPQGGVPPGDASATAQKSIEDGPQGSESIPLLPQGATVIVPQGGVPPGDASATAQKSIEDGPQGSESIPLLPQGLVVAAPHGDSTMGDVSVPAGLPQAKTADSSPNRLLQPALVPAQSNEPSTTQGDSRSTGQSVIRNGDGAPAPLEQPSGDTLPSNAQPSDFPTSDRRAALVMNEQWSRNLSPVAYTKGVVQLSGRPSAEVGPSAILQVQGAQEIVLPGQALPVSAIGTSGGGGQDPFGASAQGGGEGALFQFSASGNPESMVRGTQAQFFSDQFTLAQQSQPSSQGASWSTAMPLQNQLKLAQAFIGENQTTSMTPAPGMAQTVHVVLPSHDSGPLSVRISMTDQTVSTQFSTDRSDLGQILLTRQDQLQQNLSRSGLELGQFQVHINQEGRQEAFPDRQSRRGGEAPEQHFSPQDQNRQSHDQEQPNHRPTRALSLFA